MATTKVALLPSWDQSNAKFHMVAVFEAFHTAKNKQRVEIHGPGLAHPLKAVSDPTTPFGTAFLEKELVLGTDWYPFSPLVYTVSVEYEENGVWKDSLLETAQSTPLGSRCVLGAVFADDRAQDQDYNDTVLTITAYPYSQDCFVSELGREIA